MQPYERYALVSLLFLVVLVAVVAFWDDGSPVEAAVREDDRAVARVDEDATPLSDSRVPDGGSSGSDAMPMSGLDDVPGEWSPVTTIRGSQKRDRYDRDELPAVSSEGELSDLPRPDRYGDFGSRTSGETVGLVGGAGQGESPFTPRPQGRAWADVSGDGSTEEGVASSRPEASVPSADEVDVVEPIAPSSEDTARGPRVHVVAGGESLSSIAEARLGSTAEYARIAALKGLAEPYTIYVGQELELPAIGGSASSSPSTSRRSVSAGAREYIVRSGDVLSLVLERELGTYKRSIQQVLKLNPGMDPDRLVVGRTILLPTEFEGAEPVRRPRTSERPRLADAGRAETPDSEFVVR